MNCEEFINSERASLDTIDVKRIYIDMAGDLAAGVLLSQIVYWHLPDKNGETKLKVERNGEYWLAKKREDWWNECRITPKQFDRAIKTLEERQMVKTEVFKYNGNPMKHVKLNRASFLAVYNAILSNGVDSVKFQGGKWKFTFGEERNLPLGKNEIDQKGISKLPGNANKASGGLPPQVGTEFALKTTTETTTETTTIIPKQRFSGKSDESENSEFSPESSSLSGTSGEDDNNDCNKQDEKLTYVQSIVDYFNGLKGRYPKKIASKINRPAKTTTVEKFKAGRYRTILKWYDEGIPASYVCDWLAERIPRLKTSIGGSLNYFENKTINYMSSERKRELEEYKRKLLEEAEEDEDVYR